MKLFLILFLLISPFSLLAKAFMYVSTADSLMTYSIDTQTGELKLLDSITDSRGYKMTKISPDKKFLYAHLFKQKKTPAAIQTFEIQENGKLKKIAEIASSTGNHAYIDVDPKGQYIFALGNKPSKKQVAIAYKLNDGVADSASFTDAPVGEMGKHAIAMSPNGQYLYVPHIKINQVYQFKFDREQERIIPLKPIATKGPDKSKYPTAHDPRHLTFHPKFNIMYTSQEFGGGVSSWKINSNGTLKLWQTFQNRPVDYQFPFDPNNPEVILNKASDIHITPDAKFIYIPNRDNRIRRQRGGPQLSLDSGNDTITTYAVNQKDGSLSAPLQNISTGRHVRCLTSSGNFLYASGVYSGTIHSYKIDPKSGQLEEINLIKNAPHIQGLNSPAWMSILD
ncbi:beta-propeller fold lactonase family protein [Lentisphaera marina]|uniref:lactonase family protein n=1 Tax=Lentisphaera marina TaxID=1111041 RepID=UPI0023668F11|nr:beta-propeller fold lactonase family protein [Lentisphaera marina]MDD7987347.1 beta-propeller fold lactonase family protein [Lentisphaera marina]